MRKEEGRHKETAGPLHAGHSHSTVLRKKYVIPWSNKTLDRRQLCGLFNCRRMEGDESSATSVGLGDLPAGCLACILALTSPRDVGRLALVNRSFLEASKSDAVWEKMLPPHWQDIVRDGASTRGAMYIYEQLCVGAFIEEDEEDRQQIYWIDRPTGGVCNMLSARALDIVWGDDERYWDWRSMRGSRFEEIAFLKDVCWLEARGRFNGYLRPGKYTVAFRLQLLGSQERRRGRGDDWHEDASGWEVEPVVFSLSTLDGQTHECSRYLTTAWQLGRQQPELQNVAAARGVEDDWVEYDAGQFVVEEDDLPVDVQFSLMEIKGGHWKSGLCVDGAVVRPSFLVCA